MSLRLGGCGSWVKGNEVFRNTSEYVKTVLIPNEVKYYPNIRKLFCSTGHQIIIWS